MITPSSIQPDVALANFLQGKIRVGLSGGGSRIVKVYSDWERPTNGLEDDFIVVYINGDIEGVGMDADFARGYMMVNLYCRLNDDGSVKKNRVKRVLAQFDELLENQTTDHYHYRYDAERFITPTTPNQTSGYSVTSLNLRWHTTNNFNTE